ncbi:MAG: hypothetical protein IPM35_07990 [Myxococcales bacterium]|nr:hypothetical protein [Myxococcales bacterium]
MVESKFTHLCRRAQARGVALLAALVVLLVGGAASAAPAPMCDEHAQSIAAPFPLFPIHGGEARAGRPCWSKGKFELGRAPSPERDQPQSISADGFDRTPPAKPFALVRDRGRSKRPADTILALTCPGFADGVFRPPRH